MAKEKEITVHDIIKEYKSCMNTAHWRDGLIDFSNWFDEHVIKDKENGKKEIHRNT